MFADRGMLLTMGNGANGCLGHGDLDDVAAPKIVEALISYSVQAVACGPAHVLALTGDNQLFGWGRTDNGDIGS